MAFFLFSVWFFLCAASPLSCSGIDVLASGDFLQDFNLESIFEDGFSFKGQDDVFLSWADDDMDFSEAHYCPPQGQSAHRGDQRDDEHKTPFAIRQEKTRKRIEQLMKCFRAGSVSFDELKDTLYFNVNKTSFQMDILQAMHRGADIRLGEDGSYYYFGELDIKLTTPDKSVAIAMFDTLCQSKKKSLFSLKFNLYMQGYREYAPDFFRWLEIALIVGDVHPYERNVGGDNALFCSTLKAIWKIVQEMPDGNFAAYLKSPPEARYVKILQVKRARQVLYRLRDMKCNGDLATLKVMMKAARSTDIQGCEERRPDAPRFSVQEQLMVVLNANVNKEIDIARLWEMLSLPSKKKKGVLLASLLSLSLGKQPIIYDKDRQTVMLLDKEEAKEVPKKGTNLLTLVYDLIHRYDNKVTKEEIAHYAHYGGYWPEGFKQGGSRNFYKYLSKCKDFLAIQGYNDYDFLSKARGGVLMRRRDIWHRMFGKDGATQTLAHYTTEELKTCEVMQEFVKGEEYAVFCDYMRKIKRSDAFAERLKKGAITLLSHESFCEDCGFETWQGMWEAAGILTGRRKGGRLIYDFQLKRFYWDDVDVAPSPAKNELVAAIFSLKYQQPVMPDHVTLYMLKQQGFRHVSEDNVLEILQGLGVLGFCDFQESASTQVRALVNIILTLGSSDKSDAVRAESIIWPCSLAQRVVRWVHNGSMEKLWKAYKNTQKYAPQQKELCCTEDEMPPSKRLRLQTDTQSPEDIIRLKIPALYKFLQKETELL